MQEENKGKERGGTHARGEGPGFPLSFKEKAPLGSWSVTSIGLLSFSSFVGERDLEISPFDQENRRLLWKLYSSKNLKVFRRVENRS